jgi:hypothetical protein
VRRSPGWPLCVQLAVNVERIDLRVHNDTVFFDEDDRVLRRLLVAMDFLTDEIKVDLVIGSAQRNGNDGIGNGAMVPLVCCVLRYVDLCVICVCEF